LITMAVVTPEGYHLVVEPTSLGDKASPEASRVLSAERIQVRLDRLNVEPVSYDLRAEILYAQIGDVKCGVDSDAVYMVERVNHVTPLPGAPDIVWGLAAITGRVNMILDPSRLLGGTAPDCPCWVAEFQTKGAKWGIAAEGEWEVLSADESKELIDHSTPPGPPGLVVRRLRHGDDVVHVLSVERLAELARGEAAGGDA